MTLVAWFLILGALYSSCLKVDADRVLDFLCEAQMLMDVEKLAMFFYGAD